MTDFIDLTFHLSEELIDLEVEREGAGSRESLTVSLERRYGEEFGLEFPETKFRICGNHCPFCFVDQNPAGMRKPPTNQRNLETTVPATPRKNLPKVATKPLNAEQEVILLAALDNPARGLPRNADCTIHQINALRDRGVAEPIRVKVGNRWKVIGMRLTPGGVRRAELIAQRVTR